MLPISLTMRAFGPFLKKTTIDFTKLNKNGIYLISGATGSGKTTIFDAIVFALYGEASGDIRSQEDLRSDYAENTDKTIVEFNFMLNNEVYKVTRSPKYYISTRSTPIDAKAELILPGNKVVEKVKAVNEKIKEIIGLSSSQFRQVVMLAQGEFSKLIHATSKERDEIFRKIFGTDFYKDVEQTLKDDYKDAKQDLTQYEKNIKSILATFSNIYTSLREEDAIINPSLLENQINDLEAKLDNQKLEIKYCLQQKDKISDCLFDKNSALSLASVDNEKIKSFKETKNAYNELLQQEKEIAKLKEKLQTLNAAFLVKPLFDTRQNYISLKDDLNKKIEQRKEEFKEVENEKSFFIEQQNMIELDRQSAVNIEKTIEQINRDMKLQAKIEVVDLSIISYQKDIDKHNKILANLEAQKKSLEDKIDQLEKAQLEILETKVNVQAYEEELNNNKKALLDLEDDNNKYQALLKRKEELEILKEKTAAIMAEFDKKAKLCLKHEQKYFNGIAGILALDLHDGMPCPVCGSVIHPNKATLEESDISKDFLEKSKAELEDLRQQKDVLVKKFEALKSSFISLTDQLTTKYKVPSLSELGQVFIDKINLLNINIKKVTESLNFAKNKAQNEQNIKMSLVSIKKLQNENDVSINDINAHIAKNNGFLEQSKKQKVDFINELTFNAPFDALKKNLEERKEALNMLTDAIKNYDLEKKKADEKYFAISSELNTLKASYDELIIKEEKTTTQLNDELIKNNISLHLLIDLTKTDDRIDINNTINNYETKLAMLREKLASLAEYENRNEIDITDLEEELKTLKLALTKIEDKLNTLQGQNIFTDTRLVDLKKNYTGWKDAYQRVNILYNLSQAASGQRNYHLSFERYVLTEYFEQILSYANIRLLRITNGRYRLCRKQEDKSGSAQQGLDMEIFDYETGKLRDVSTLSGGETFKAALSLALGLADAIENKAGGVIIDSLFIDEGFGTLDNESLQQAMQILLDLKNDDKCIAIISHVQDLKDLISIRVDVSKDDIGSKIEIIEK